MAMPVEIQWLAWSILLGVVQLFIAAALMTRQLPALAGVGIFPAGHVDGAGGTALTAAAAGGLPWVRTPGRTGPRLFR